METRLRRRGPGVGCLSRFAGHGAPLAAHSCLVANPATQNIVATAIPKITDQFHALDDIGWYGSALFLTVASSQSVWGKAYKFLDLKNVFLVSVAIFEIGSLICGATTLPHPLHPCVLTVAQLLHRTV